MWGTEFIVGNSSNKVKTCRPHRYVYLPSPISSKRAKQDAEAHNLITSKTQHQHNNIREYKQQEKHSYTQTSSFEQLWTNLSRRQQCWSLSFLYLLKYNSRRGKIYHSRNFMKISRTSLAYEDTIRSLRCPKMSLKMYCLELTEKY